MLRRVPHLLVAASVAVLGCTGGDEAQPTTTPAPATTTPPPTSAPPAQLTEAELAQALASRNPAELGGVRALVQPGSAADRYLAHQAAARSLLPESDAATVRLGSGTAQVCDGADCVIVADLARDATGLLTSFSVEGAPIDGRVAGPGATATVENLSVTALSTVQSVDGVVTALVETRNSSAAGIEWFGFAATYASGNTARVEAAGTWGPSLVASSTIELMLISFPDASLPGRITLTGLRDDDIDVIVTIEVPVPT